MYNDENYYDDFSLNGEDVAYLDSNDDESLEYDDDESFEYDDDESLEYDDDESIEYDDDETSGEAIPAERRWGRFFRRSRYRRKPRVARGRRFGRSRFSRFRGRGVINTPAGKASIKLPGNIATKPDLQKIEKKVLANNKAILKNGKAIIRTDNNSKKVEKDLSARIIAQGKKVAKNVKSLESVQQSVMFSSLLGGPQSQQVELTPVNNDGSDQTNATSTRYKVNIKQSDNTNALLPLMMGGGMSGGGSSNNMMMPLMLLTLQDDDNKDNSTLLLAVAMMSMSSNK